jgi:hypothetical protein
VKGGRGRGRIVKGGRGDTRLARWNRFTPPKAHGGGLSQAHGGGLSEAHGGGLSEHIVKGFKGADPFLRGVLHGWIVSERAERRPGRGPGVSRPEGAAPELGSGPRERARPGPAQMHRWVIGTCGRVRDRLDAGATFGVLPLPGPQMGAQDPSHPRPSAGGGALAYGAGSGRSGPVPPPISSRTMACRRRRRRRRRLNPCRNEFLPRGGM